MDASEGNGHRRRALSDKDIQKIAPDRGRSFRDEAPTSAVAAAKIILSRGAFWSA